MAYTPPVGEVILDLTGTSYTLPVGEVILDLGATAAPDRTLNIAGETLAPTGAASVQSGRVLAGTGETLAPTGHAVVLFAIPVTVAGETLGPTGGIVAAYDPNLLSDVIASVQPGWREGLAKSVDALSPMQDVGRLDAPLPERWQEARHQDKGFVYPWSPSGFVHHASQASASTAPKMHGGFEVTWRTSPRVLYDPLIPFREATLLTRVQPARFRARLTLLPHPGLPLWQEASPLTHSVRQDCEDGPLILTGDASLWREAILAWYGINTGPPIPIIIAPWGTRLYIRCHLPGTRLIIGGCSEAAIHEVLIQRSYVVHNSASLVRWPDLTPLPVTSMTVETDFDSWCWALTATLAGPDAWALVQPNPLACEVQATINGQVWRFLLDVPNLSRSFNQNRVTLKGRSRSAWLHDPFTPSRNMTQSEARDMTQLAALAVENTGWTVDWKLEDWRVPVGRYNSFTTPIGALIRLANVTDDGIYTHPVDQIITLHKRWPVASWLLDGETMDILIPEAAILSLTQNPVYSQPLNGVYISGISHGALALVKIAGTDGALQPAEPITDELLCDEAGVAARQRGLNALSDSGAGWEMDAETLFAPSASPAFPLVPPGQIVSIAGLKGISRSCRITAQRSGGVLSVRQSIGLERREVEA